jgi:hypothetical protein
MEAPEVLARRLMSDYEDRLSLKQICDEILVVLRDGGLRLGDPVPADLVAAAEERLALVASTPGQRSFVPVPRDPHPDRVRPRRAGRTTMRS